MPKGKSNRPTLEDFRRELARYEGQREGLVSAGGDTLVVDARIELLKWAVGPSASAASSSEAPSAPASA